MKKPVRISFFPVAIDRNSAPEAANPNSARIMVNIRQGPWEGRLRRRLGLSPTNVTDIGVSVRRCLAFAMEDGTTAMFDSTDSGSVRVTESFVPTYSELDYFGTTRDSQLWRENFQEDGA